MASASGIAGGLAIGDAPRAFGTLPPMTDLARLDLIGHAELVRSGEATALELLDAAIARIEAARELNAVICDLFDRAREQAAAPLPDGPLAGAPFLLKDVGEPLAGVPERMGSVALRDHVSAATSVVVQRYLAAGLVIAGKTNTPEWGNHCTTEPVLFGPTVNPRAPGRSPGGSSGGSAAPGAGRVGRRAGGVERRLGARRGGRARAGGVRRRRHGLDPRARLRLRRDRPQARAGAQDDGARRRTRARGAGQRARAHPQRARLRRAAGRDARPGPGRPVRRAGTRRAV